MKFIHVKNLEKYHPGYKDRRLRWMKTYFDMVQGDPDCEVLDEIDWSRLVKIIILELQARRPLPLNDAYFMRKGFDVQKRSMSDTLNMLQKFIVYCNENGDESVTVSETSLENSVDQNKSKSKKKSKTKKERGVVTEPVTTALARPQNGKVGKPTFEDVEALFMKKGYPEEAQGFYDYYEANGWRVGKNPMKSWTHAVQNWIRNCGEYHGRGGKKQTVQDRASEIRREVDHLD